MPRHRGLARVCSFFGVLAAFGAWWSFSLARTAFDPELTASVAGDLLSAEPIQRELRDNLTTSLEQQLPDEAAPAEITLAVERTLADPAFASAFGDAIAEVQAQILSDDPGPVELDTAAVTDAVRASLATVDADLAARIAPGEGVRLDLGDRALPSIGTFDDRIRGWSGLLAAMAVVFLSFGVVLDPVPSDALRRTGRRLIGLGTPTLILLAVGPPLVRRFGGETGTVVAPLLHAAQMRLALPAAVLTVAGITLWAAARIVTPAPSPARTGDRPTRTVAPAPGDWTPRPTTAASLHPATSDDRRRPLDLRL